MVQGSRVQGSRVQGSGFRVQGSGFRVQGSGFLKFLTLQSLRQAMVQIPEVQAACAASKLATLRRELKKKGNCTLSPTVNPLNPKP